MARRQRSPKPLKAASPTPLQPLGVPGKRRRVWASLFNVESLVRRRARAPKQRAAIDKCLSEMDFVRSSLRIDIDRPGQQMIDAGIPSFD